MTTFKSNADVMPTVGIITFDSYIDMYVETLRYVSWKLQQMGCKVVKVGCDGVLGACTSINSQGKSVIDSNTKEAICKICKAEQLKISADRVSNVTSNQALLKQDAIDFLSEVELTLNKQLVASAVLDMHHLGLPLCKIAFFDFSITLKVSSNSPLSGLDISRFMLGLKDLVILQQHLEALLQQNSFTHIVFVNGNYSLNTCVRLICQNKKIVPLSIEPQPTSQHVLNGIILKRDRIELLPEALFPVASEMNAYPQFVSRIIKNYGARIAGGDFNAYTSLNAACDQNEAEKLKNFFTTYSRVHSFFMSSEDELVPHAITHDFVNRQDEETRAAYKDQFEFTKFYLAEAEKSPDIGFIIRMHPRMAVNKRDAFESAEHLRYKKLIENTDLAPNVLVIFGDSKISSYFVISKSSLVVVSWSTIGLEALMMGVRVVSAFPNALMYPLDKLSRQPINFNELKNALFSCSTYGKADDMRLFGWVSMAHEGQFFSTPAPRGQGGLWARVYRLIYRAIDKLGIYNLAVYWVDAVWFRGTIFSNAVLLTKHAEEGSPNLKRVHKLVNSYRTKTLQLLNQYESVLFRSAPSGVSSNSQIQNASHAE